MKIRVFDQLFVLLNGLIILTFIQVWQYISLTKRINLIDCPGIVYNSDDTQTDIVLKGVVRAEKIQDPEVHIQQILDRADRASLISIYGIEKWEDAQDYLEQLAIKMGKLIKGGDANVDAIARLMI